MRRPLVLVALALAGFWFLFADGAVNGAGQEVAEEAGVRQVVREWLEAEGRGSHAALERIFADDFVGHSFGGNIVYKHDVVPPEDGPPRITQGSLKETTVRLFGATAVAMGRVGVADPERPGEFLFTFVLLKRDARWQLVAAHLSR